MTTDDLPGLYVITDRRAARRGLGSVCEVVEAAVEGGARFFQYRDKEVSPAERWRTGRRLADILEGTGATWLVNDRADLAVGLGADGVHRPGDGLPVSALRAALPEGACVGLSTHDASELGEASGENVDFVTLSPVFPPGSKTSEVEPLGPEAFETLADRVDLPVYALGGITPERAARCVDAGADGVAVVSGVMSAEEPESAVRAYLEALAG